MKIAILGFGLQGRAAFDYWDRPGNELTVCDKNKDIDLPKGAYSQLGESYLKNLSRFDLVVRTPVLHPRDIIAANSKAILDKVTTVTNEFFKVCPTKNIVGVTGTKGKGTTCTLIAKMLESAGKRVHLGGNIGIPPLELLKGSIQPDDWVVLELANFQLIDLKHSPHMAVCLMVEPEHQDWHSGMDEYVTAKQQLFAHQSKDDIAIYYVKNIHSKSVVSASPARKIPFLASPGTVINKGVIKIGSQEICKTSELKMLGEHNWQNACAAATVFWQISQDVKPIRKVLTAFAGLPHRLEFVREVNGVKYYNDSFASAPPAAEAAIEAIPEPKIMIMGGYDRGLGLKKLARKVVDGNVKHVVAIGQAAHKLLDAIDDLKDRRLVERTSFGVGKVSMQEIVNAAKEHASPGDAVVLSPGFASFDMFKDFEDRGLQFKTCVNKL